MTILSLLLAVAKLLNIGIKYADDRQLLSAGAKTAIADQLTTGLGMVRHAQDVRNSVTADNVDTQLDLLRDPSKRASDRH